MYNTILLNLTSNLNPNDFMLLLITFIWVGYIIYSYTKKNSITKKGKEVLKSIKEIIKKESIHIGHELTQIKNFCYTTMDKILSNISNNLDIYLNNVIYNYYYIIFLKEIQLYNFKNFIYKKSLKFKSILSVVVSLFTTSFITILINIITIFIKGERIMLMVTLIFYLLIVASILVLHHFSYTREQFDNKIKELNDKDKEYNKNVQKLNYEYDKNVIKYLKNIIKFTFVSIIIIVMIFGFTNKSFKEKELKIEKQNYVHKFNDLYLEKSSLSFNQHLNDEIIYDNFTIKIIKNKNNHTVTYQLLDNITRDVIENKVLKYEKDLN